MKHIIKIKLLSIIFILILFSGCTEQTNNVNDNSNTKQNINPIGVINAPSEKYFNEIIEFDASNSYDTDGNIVSYNWDFGDGINDEGMVVDHVYEFINNYTIEYPIIYPVCLFIKDDKGATTAFTHQIKIFPKEYVLYLTSGKIIFEKPKSSNEKIRGTGLFKINSPNSILYSLERSILIPKCNWNITIYLEKSLFLYANKIRISLFDDENQKISEIEAKINKNYLWKEESIDLKGNFQNEVEFYSLKIEIIGFSVRDNINIFYGGNKASQIHFIFSYLD